MALDLASPQRHHLHPDPASTATENQQQPKLFHSFFQPSPKCNRSSQRQSQQHQHQHHVAFESPDYALRRYSQPARKPALRSKSATSAPGAGLFPAPNLSTTSPQMLSEPLFLDSSRPSSTTRRSPFLFPREAAFELDHCAATSSLPHKQSYFELTRGARGASRKDLSSDADVDMGSESDSTASESSGASSVFSDAEEDDDEAPASAASSTPSLYAALDDYFAGPAAAAAAPAPTVPLKHATQPMKSLANPSLLLNKPQLAPEFTSAQVRPPAKAATMSWAMPSFGPTHTPVFPRHVKVRRTQSMFEHPEDVIAAAAKEASDMSSPADACQSVLAKDNCPIKSYAVAQDPFRRISRDTLCEILDNRHVGSVYDRHVVVDCRFEYEYEGGHIDGAININCKEGLEQVLIASASASENSGSEKVLLVFHCEYSAHRGPRMAMQLRNLDRQANMNRYPYLHYPDIAILDGGYSSFFETCHARCFPPRYVEMNDSLYADRCEREMEKFRRAMRFSRTQSFTTTSTATATPVLATKSVSLSYSPRSTLSSTTTTPLVSTISAFKFPLRPDPSMDSSSPSFSLSSSSSSFTLSSSTPSFNSFGSPISCISSSSFSLSSSFSGNLDTPTQAHGRRLLTGFPKLAQAKLFS